MAGVKKPVGKKTSAVKKILPAKKTSALSTIKKTTKKNTISKKTTTMATKPIVFDSKGKKLVIVESPGKVKTISKYLGTDYIIKASVGHIVDLVDKNMSKLVEKGFEPDYEVDPAKKKVVSELKSLAKSSSQVILATDEDREGEAIAYHLTQALGIDPKTTPRIVFNEITKPALLDAMQRPRKLDMNLISAQKSRAVLDKLVGFSISPILWQKIKMGLSAGRVQSVAVKLVVEKEREIENFVPVEYRVIKAILDTNKGPVEILLKKLDGVKDIEEIDELDMEVVKKTEKESGGRFSKSALETVLNQLHIKKAKSSIDDKTGYESLRDTTGINFQLVDVVTKQSKKSPSAPFITSTLQQTASRIFGWPVKQVMSAAQKLYEAGLITYMRTDSTSLSGQAIAQCKEYILGAFGEKYSTVRQYKSKSKNAQEAHEAIRPTSISNEPDQLKLGQYEQRLYSLIWKRTLASQMSDAIFTNTSYIFHPVI
ncbi:MAG: type I DNA topoisomerase [Candidatus Absconditabacterales bacterium]